MPIWGGCDTLSWVRLLARNHFAVQPSRWHLALLISFFSILNTVMRFAQQALWWRPRRLPRTADPIFVLGHWRTGTTHLHELLCQDPRHAFPTTHDCMSPHHFLLSRSWMPTLLRGIIPSRRPMDNVAVGWERPLEDEFAIALLGEPTPYERIAFPNQAAGDGALDLRGLSRQALDRWKSTFRKFVQEVCWENDGRRLILKSPPHTCRIPFLMEMFPDARFIHIVRDPYVVYASTLHLWRVLYAAQALQRPAWERLPDYILDTFVRFHERLREGKRLLPASQFCELRYEDLVRNPSGQVESIYRKLELGDFEPLRPRLATYLDSIRAYETNRHLLTADEESMITRRWESVIREQGYALRQQTKIG